jgi:transcription antitermination factor NusG
MPKSVQEDAQAVQHDSNVPWYALQVRPRYESLSLELLSQKGLDAYLPLYSVRRRWSDRYVETKLPLFPGYIFCRLDYRDRVLPVLTTPGVVRVLGVGRMPMPVDERELDVVRLVVESGRALHPWPLPQVGDRVILEHGPLAGVEGIIIGQKKQRRLVVSVTLLRRSVAVEIEDDWARPIGHTPGQVLTGLVPANAALARA